MKTRLFALVLVTLLCLSRAVAAEGGIDSAGSFLPLSAGGTRVMTLTASGFVGIGTTTPSETLSVLSEDAIVASLSSAGTPRSVLRIQNVSGTSYSGAVNLGIGTHSWELGSDYYSNRTSSFYLYDLIAGALRLFVDAAGKVGIGTALPQAKLDVNGDIRGAGVTVGYSAVCDAARAGTLRWTGSAFEGCDGSSWIAFGGKKQVINTGIVGHGETIPLPAGYTQDRCVWFVSLYSKSPNGGGYTDYQVIYADANRRVSVYHTNYGTVRGPDYANYIIFCE